MITISRIVSWQGVDGCNDDRGAIRELEVAVGDLGRAARFYGRVFGFYRDIEAQNGDSESFAMRTATGVRLVLHAVPTSLESKRWGFVVENLDEVRARVWDHGVVVARDSGAPDHVYWRLVGGSLYVHDRDCNEIELVELAPRTRLACARSHSGAPLGCAYARGSLSATR